jgi:quinol monooxygenase YgiN
VLVITQFSVSETEGERFAGQARVALAALAARPGYRRGHLGRAVDDPGRWLLLTEWDGVGAYRRALSAYEVRVQAVPLLALGQPEPGAFEILTTIDHAGADVVTPSDRAPDADTVGPGAIPPAQPTAAADPSQRDPVGGRAAPPPPRPGDRTGQETS